MSLKVLLAGEATLTDRALKGLKGRLALNSGGYGRNGHVRGEGDVLETKRRIDGHLFRGYRLPRNQGVAHISHTSITLVC